MLTSAHEAPGIASVGGYTPKGPENTGLSRMGSHHTAIGECGNGYK
jgi:hypothetical protein